MAVGGSAEAGPIRQERPGRLRGDTPSRLSAARLSLDGRRAGTLAVRALLADAVRKVPAAAEGPAAGAAQGRARSRISRLAATATAPADDHVPVPVPAPDTAASADADAGANTPTEPEPESGSDTAALLVVHVVHVGVVAHAPADGPAQFAVPAVVVVVVHPVAAVAASKVGVFLLALEGADDASHAATFFHPSSLAFHLQPPPHRSFFFLLFRMRHSSLFVALLSLAFCSFLNSTFLFLMYHFLFFFFFSFTPSFRLCLSHFFSISSLHSSQDFAHAHTHVPPPSPPPPPPPPSSPPIMASSTYFITLLS